MSDKGPKIHRELQEFEQKKAFAKAVLPYQDVKIFKFKASKDSAEKSGYVRAKTRDAAVKGLLDSGYTILEVNEVTVESTKTVPLVYNPLTVQEAVAIFTRQLLVLYRSGVPLNRAVSILFVQTEEKHLKSALASMYMDMVKGVSFTRSISRHPHVFHQDYVAMIDSGEKSGELSTVLERLADLLEKNISTLRKVISSMTYPLIVLFFAFAVNFAIFKWVLPHFMEIFEQMDAEMPALTIMIMQIVRFMQTPWFWVLTIALTFIGGYGLFQVIKEPSIKFMLDKLLLKVPQISKMMKRLVFIKTFRVFATMLASGVIMSKALHNVAQVAGNEVYRRAYDKMIFKVEKGDSLPECFDKEKELFPLIVRQMIHVGDETGEPEIVLNLLADFYEVEMDLALETLSSIIEPVMIAFMGVITGIVVLSIFLPIYNLINQLL